MRREGIRGSGYQHGNEWWDEYYYDYFRRRGSVSDRII